MKNDFKLYVLIHNPKIKGIEKLGNWYFLPCELYFITKSKKAIFNKLSILFVENNYHE